MASKTAQGTSIRPAGEARREGRSKIEARLSQLPSSKSAGLPDLTGTDVAPPGQDSRRPGVRRPAYRGYQTARLAERVPGAGLDLETPQETAGCCPGAYLWFLHTLRTRLKLRFARPDASCELVTGR